jgi:hypothetical protein
MKSLINKGNQDKSDKLVDLFVTKLAELRLSELGMPFIPGVYPVWQRFKSFIEAKALIVKPEGELV